MNTLKVIFSQEYRMNKPSVFIRIDGQYYGCLIYPTLRKFPDLDYWETATSSDTDRGFTIIEKEFTDEEVNKIKALQTAVDALKTLIPEQPKWEVISTDKFKIRRGKAYEEYLDKTAIQEEEVRQYFTSIEVFDKAVRKAHNDLTTILNK
jgi:hypothetical protein